MAPRTLTIPAWMTGDPGTGRKPAGRTTSRTCSTGMPHNTPADATTSHCGRWSSSSSESSVGSRPAGASDGFVGMVEAEDIERVLMRGEFRHVTECGERLP